MNLFVLTVIVSLAALCSAYPLYEEPLQKYSRAYKLDRLLAAVNENAPATYAQAFKEDPYLVAASDPLPMVHNNNYDMIMPGDQQSAESMAFQDFDKFYDPQMVGNAELDMNESQQFIYNTPVRAPQPLSAAERRVRSKLHDVDVSHERRVQQKLTKGSTVPREDAPQWDLFDYDSYSSNPGKNSYYG